MKRRDSVTAYLMIAPAFALLCVFVIAPLFMALRYSFFNVSFYLDSTFIGLNNFRMILRTALFRQSLLNAIKFVLILIPSTLILGFLAANALVGLPRKFSSAVKTAMYIPGVVAAIAVGLIFNFIFNFNAGIINQTLKSLGMSKIAFYNTEFTATLSICSVSLWIGLGGTVILMYAARLNIPIEYYEAASIDGAGSLSKMLKITIPQMKNIFVLVCIGSTTATLQMFDLPYIMTLGGPVNKTLTPMLYLYNNYRDANKTIGYTVAGALILMVIISVVNGVVFTVIKSEKSLEG